MEQTKVRHHTLPQHLTLPELMHWLQSNSVDRFSDEEKHYFSPDELAEFEHESSVNGRTKNRLEDLLKTVNDYVKNGTEEAITIEIPANIGTKLADKTRRQNDDLIECGYEKVEMEVFGIVNQIDEVMEYVTENGILIPERTRELTTKEKLKFLDGVRHVGSTLRPVDTSKESGTDLDAANDLTGTNS